MTADEQPPVIGWLILACVATAMVKLLAGCGGSSPEPEVPRVIVERRVCIDKPPPVPKPVEIIGPRDGCPQEFTGGCLMREDLEQVLRYLYLIDRYAAKAWATCGPKPTPGEPHAPPPAPPPPRPVPPPEPPPPLSAELGEPTGSVRGGRLAHGAGRTGATGDRRHAVDHAPTP